MADTTPADKDPNESVSNWLSRRRVMALTGAGLATGLAGCGGDSGGSPTSTEADMGTQSPEPAAEPLDDTFSATMVPGVRPEDAQFNIYNPKGWEYVMAYTAIFNDLGRNRRDNGQIYAPLASDWELVDDTTFEITLSDEDWTWHDGNAFTAQDVATVYRLSHYMGGAGAGFVEDPLEDFEVVDDGMVRINLMDSGVESLLELVFISGRGLHQQNTPYTVYNEFVEKFADAAGDEDATKEVKTELSQFAPQGTDVIGTGPFQFTEDSIRENRIVLETFDDFPHADTVNWPQVEFIFASGGGSGTQMTLSGDLDRPGGVTAEQRDQLPFEYQDVPSAKFGGLAVNFNYDHPIIGRRRVRQALAWITDRRKTVKVRGDRDFYQDNFLGIPDAYAEPWVGDLIPQTDHYKTENDGAAKATALLEAEGFSKEDGKWYTPDDEVWRLPIKAPGGGTRINFVQVLVSDYKDFGIEAEAIGVERSSYWNQAMNSDFQIFGFIFGDRGSPHPYFDYEWCLVNRDEPLVWCNVPDEFELPPVGEPDSDDRITINPHELHDQFPSAGPEKGKEIIQKIAWVYNQSVPQIPLANAGDPDIVRTDNWNYPEKSHGTMQVGIPAVYPLVNGHLSAKTE